MWRTRAEVSLFLCVALMTSGALTCDQDSPRSCEFQFQNGSATFCDWSAGGNATLKKENEKWHLALISGDDKGNLTSRISCPTEGRTHCFRFAYRLEMKDIFVLNLSMITYNQNKTVEILLWMVLSSNGWSEASIPINTTNRFRVIFRARRLCEQSIGKYAVAIDRIRFNENHCTFQPLVASPQSVSLPLDSCHNTISSILSTTEPSSSNKTGMKTTTWNSNPAFSGGRDHLSNSTMTSAMSSTDFSTVQPAESSYPLAIVIGVVVGVVVIIVIVIILLILFRRKRRHSLKAHNAQSTAGSHRPDPGTSSQPSDNTHVMADPQNPTASDASALPLYAVVNKPRKNNQENPTQSPYEIDDQDTEHHTHKASLEHPPQSPYEIDDQGIGHHIHHAEEHRAEEQGHDRDGISSAPRNPGLLMASNGAVYQVPRGDTATASQDQDEEYNALDFEGKRCVAGNRLAEGDNEYGAGMVYNHLDGGDEDAYNEVDRQRRGEVLGDEYSHI